MKKPIIAFYRNAFNAVACEIQMHDELVFSSERPQQIATALFMMGAADFTFSQDGQSTSIPFSPSCIRHIPSGSWDNLDEMRFWVDLSTGILMCTRSPLPLINPDLQSVLRHLPGHLMVAPFAELKRIRSDGVESFAN